jgi:hypothetical protein
MRKPLFVAALALLATSAWAQSSSAQGISFARGAQEPSRLLDAARQIDLVPAHIRGDFPGMGRQDGHVVKVALTESGNFRNLLNTLKRWRQNATNHGAPIPLAGGLPALVLIGAALVMARTRRR